MQQANESTGDHAARAIALLEAYLAGPRASGSGDLAYAAKHRARFEQTLGIIPPAPHGAARALELGATAFLQVALRGIYGYAEVLGTHVSSRIEEKLCRKDFAIGSLAASNLSFSLDLENELLPLADGSVDLALCCEVRRPAVVSALGSFVEFGDAVVPVRPGSGVEQVADAILAAARTPPAPESMRRYVETHSPGLFRQALLEMVDASFPERD